MEARGQPHFFSRFPPFFIVLFSSETRSLTEPVLTISGMLVDQQAPGIHLSPPQSNGYRKALLHLQALGLQTQTLILV